MVSLGGVRLSKGRPHRQAPIQRVSETMDEERPHVMVQIGLPLFSLRLLEIARCRTCTTIITPLSRGLVEFKTERFAAL